MAGEPAPGYLDAVGGEVTKASDGTFTFVETLATALPDKPKLPAGDAALGWSVCVDVDPTVAPVGFPMTIAMPCEFIVHTRWDGRRLAGLLIDRRPLAAGGSAKTTPFDPIVDGTSVRMEVSEGALGDPASFRWSMFTEELGPLGTDQVVQVDAVPDGGVGDPAAWPSD